MRVRTLNSLKRQLALRLLTSDDPSDEQLPQERPQRRSYAVHPYLQDRSVTGEYVRLVESTYNNHPTKFKLYFKMTRETFDFIFSHVRVAISKQETQLKTPIPASLRFALALRVLVHGDTFRDVAMRYKVGESTARGIFSDVCLAIWGCLSPMFMPAMNQQGWLKVAERYEEMWQYPHCLGAVDGKHIRITCPANSGSEYFNYKSYFSMILMAVCDADKRFLVVDVGQYGSRNDASVFDASAFGRLLAAGQLDLPQPTCLYDDGPLMPYVFVGDEAFALRENFMRSFPEAGGLTAEEECYNYRHKRARLPIENTFGIMVKKFAILSTAMNMAPEKAVAGTKAATVLHNVLRTRALGDASSPQQLLGYGADDDDDGNSAGSHQGQNGAFDDLHAHRGRPSNAAREVRQKFLVYFNGRGKLPRQMRQ